jgi:hypothetical protein
VSGAVDWDRLTGDDLLALLADEVEPTVVVRRHSNGDTDLLTSFEM